MEAEKAQLTFGRPYATGPFARTDLHAGGIFFCVVYRDCIEFSDNGDARRWAEVMDGSRPFDNEVEEIRNDTETGAWHVNELGYIVCEFKSRTLTGLPCTEAKELIAFNGYRVLDKRSFGVVYALT